MVTRWVHGVAGDGCSPASWCAILDAHHVDAEGLTVPVGVDPGGEQGACTVGGPLSGGLPRITCNGFLLEWMEDSELASILFLSQQFTDQRIWGDIPSRLRDRHYVVTYDWYEVEPTQTQIPWQTRPGSDPRFLETIRELAPVSGGFDVVAAAGDAAPLAIDLGAADLAKGTALFQPTPDSIPAEMDLDNLPGLEQNLLDFSPVLEALDAEPARQKELLITACRNSLAAHLENDDLELVCQVLADHTEAIISVTKAAIDNTSAPPPVDSWIDRLGELDIPLKILVPRTAPTLGQTLAARAPRGEAVLVDGHGLLWLEDRTRTLATLRSMLAL